jgi:predicted transcriptional regulator
MPRKRDEESGQYTENYPLELFIDAIRDAEDNMAGTSEIAEIVGCSHRLALLRLNTLVEQGRIQRRDIGRSNVWMLTEGNDE